MLGQGLVGVKITDGHREVIGGDKAEVNHGPRPEVSMQCSEGRGATMQVQKSRAPSI